MISWIRRIFSRSADLDRDVRDEIQFHLDSRAELNEQAGQAAPDATATARKQFGNATRIYEETRSVHISELVESIAQDVRYALRSFFRTPAFTIAAVCAIALGIAASSAVFSVVDRILFRSLPYAHEERLAWVGMGAPIEPNEFLLGSDYIEWRQSQSVFESFTSASGVTDCDITDSNPTRLSCGRVESNFLSTLGIRPLAGRDFTKEEDLPNGPGAAMLSYGLWQSRYGRDGGIVGKKIQLDGQPTPIVGVLPPGFELPNMAHPDVLLPQRLDEADQRKRHRFVLLTTFARLKPGVTIEQARAGLQPLFANSLQFVPAQFRKEVTLKVSPLRDRQVRDAKLASWMLFASVLCVLLIACANVANLLLARAASRQREESIRAALGAGKLRLLRQNLTESMVLAFIGALIGIAGGYGLLRVLIAAAPKGIPRLAEATLDARVLVFSIAAALLCGAIFGLAPTLVKIRPASLMGSRITAPPHLNVRNWLVSAQIAMSVVLLTGAGLLLQSLWKLQNIQLGLRPDNVITANVSLTKTRYPSVAHMFAFFEDLESRASRLPGVQAVAVSDSVPPGGRQHATIYSAIVVDGRPPTPGGTGGMVVHRFVTPGYFATLGIPILSGRGFTDADRRSKDGVIVLGDSLARRLFPNENPIGKRLQPGNTPPWRTVIGVAADVKNAGLLLKDDPEYYELMTQRPEYANRSGSLVIRTSASTPLIAGLIREQVRELDPNLPVAIETLPARVSSFIARPRFNTMVLGLFALIGLVLAAVGLYGVLAFLVAQRSQEIGVRMALGATRRQISALILSHAARWTGIGAIAGVAGALATTRYLTSLLYDVRAQNPWTVVGVLVVLSVVAFTAAWLPSRRAARLDPMTMLRHD